ncbi:MAG: hypothetical protein P1U47_00755 [Zhongshania sp.]|uniref:hypothetical protein n=1 Tax=Zhongshania sp. TaxID=1971902 RepID=UPI002623D033|nr:hypothetical protein [Zhongshania sp.]MDF1690873.1 hypothetical protein [Zhongshania sp.]
MAIRYNNPTLPCRAIQWDGLQKELILDWSIPKGRKRYQTLSSWDQGLKSRYNRDEKLVYQAGAIPGDWLYHSELEPVNAWKETIPTKVRRFVECVPTGKMKILKLTFKCPPFADVLQINPKLAWMIFVHGKRNKLDISQIEALCSLKQHIILGELGFCGSKSIVRILRKFSECNARPEYIYGLVEMLAAPEPRKFFSHVKYMSGEQLSLFLNIPWLLMVPFGKLVSTLDSSWEISRVKFLYEKYASFDMLPFLGRVKSIPEMNARYDAFFNCDADKSRKTLTRMWGLERLLNLPLPEGRYVKALRTLKAIDTQSMKGGLCLRLYTVDSINGTISFYVIPTTPTPLTISVVKHDGGELRIGDAKHFNNVLPSEEEYAYVQTWFKSALELKKHGSCDADLASVIVSEAQLCSIARGDT